MTANITTVVRIETHTGFPTVHWRDTLNGRREFATLYWRVSDGGFYHEVSHFQSRRELREAILVELRKLNWAHGRNCLASAPRLNSQAP